MKERKYQTVVKNQNNFFVVELNIFLLFYMANNKEIRSIPTKLKCVGYFKFPLCLP